MIVNFFYYYYSGTCVGAQLNLVRGNISSGYVKCSSIFCYNAKINPSTKMHGVMCRRQEFKYVHKEGLCMPSSIPGV